MARAAAPKNIPQPVSERAAQWGRNLKTARQLLGLTQAQLAAEVKVRQSSVARWERGVVTPRDDMKIRLASVLRQEVRSLFPLYGQVA